MRSTMDTKREITGKRARSLGADWLPALSLNLPNVERRSSPSHTGKLIDCQDGLVNDSARHELVIRHPSWSIPWVAGGRILGMLKGSLSPPGRIINQLSLTWYSGATQVNEDKISQLFTSSLSVPKHILHPPLSIDVFYSFSSLISIRGIHQNARYRYEPDVEIDFSAIAPEEELEPEQSTVLSTNKRDLQKELRLESEEDSYFSKLANFPDVKLICDTEHPLRRTSAYLYLRNNRMYGITAARFVRSLKKADQQDLAVLRGKLLERFRGEDDANLELVALEKISTLTQEGQSLNIYLEEARDISYILPTEEKWNTLLARGVVLGLKDPLTVLTPHLIVLRSCQIAPVVISTSPAPPRPRKQFCPFGWLQFEKLADL
ncbi:hypothetical protein P175DRAFT_0530320 [Aspergillus ochraceoroseus IBT 24754]|uniref:Uncharacterized protein n=1 Tax=Aspergillus ochraceoroseus IBT 24754 TaxID=1392256 RepID=A0A2T5M3U5_9EURO|nr:uncharacterized protein P175DRAFT_0530320 [Aspergillus ochraceoroseus IBT 24754]PTU23213.1 hypothetical protein P175DRAFT_0530320 [Aspergillus ochraceoroseus IBT 24754]